MKKIDVNKLDVFQLESLRQILVRLSDHYVLQQYDGGYTSTDLPEWKKDIIDKRKAIQYKIGKIDEIMEDWALNELFKEEDK